jgi:hypothetical protein
VTQMTMLGGRALIVCDGCGAAVDKASLFIIPDEAGSKPYRYHADCVECFRAWIGSTGPTLAGTEFLELAAGPDRDPGADPGTSTFPFKVGTDIAIPEGDVVIDGVHWTRRDGTWVAKGTWKGTEK